MILGIDEVGRGPWAGPLVVGAVVLGGATIDGLTDSKKLSKKRREALSPEIYEKSQAVALGWVTACELDEIGMSEALRLATRRAVEQIKTPYHEIIIDGTVNFLSDTAKGTFVTTMPKADLLIPSVSAASIVAKVARDQYMADQDIVYPGYGFAQHVGYGVAKHRAAIESLGVTQLHRLSFAPLAKYRQGFVPSPLASKEKKRTQQPNESISTRTVGNLSETVACGYLRARGHQVVERNWRTRWCEIDIVSELDNTVYFTEVKHRKNDKTGDGLMAITPSKLKQMKFAAELYATRHPHQDLRLAVIATTKEPPEVIDFLEIR